MRGGRVTERQMAASTPRFESDAVFRKPAIFPRWFVERSRRGILILRVQGDLFLSPIELTVV
jgi:hypothetical protein